VHKSDVEEAKLDMDAAADDDDDEEVSASW